MLPLGDQRTTSRPEHHVVAPHEHAAAGTREPLDLDFVEPRPLLWAEMSASRTVHTELSPTSESNGYSDRRGTTDHLPRWITASMRNAVDSAVARRLVWHAVHCDAATVTAAPTTASG